MNEPERLYLDTEVIHPAGRRKVSIYRTSDTDIEYVRTDAFIEKAAEWIKNKAENYIVDTPLCSYFDYKRAVEDFKDYTKGE